MKKQKSVRSPRFVVPNNEQAVVSIGSEKLKGTLHMLSLTGGTIRLEKRFASGTFADIGIQTASGTFTAAIELRPEQNARAGMRDPENSVGACPQPGPARAFSPVCQIKFCQINPASSF